MKRKKETSIILVQDTREQLPLDFSPFPDVLVETGTLWPGDYTVKGFEKSIAFERKSVGDLIGTLKDGYVGRASIRRYESRFDLELEEFERHYDRTFVIVEPDAPVVIRLCGGDPAGCDAGRQIANGWYRSTIPPNALFAFIRALVVEYGCHVYLAASRADAAAEIVAIARLYVASRRHVIHRGKIAQALKAESERAPWD